MLLVLSPAITQCEYTTDLFAVALPSGRCLPNTPTPLPGPEGFVSSHIASSPCLWRIQAEPGQQISVYLINFNANNGQTGTEKLGYVKHMS